MFTSVQLQRGFKLVVFPLEEKHTFPCLFHCYCRAMNIFVHHACIHSRVCHSRLAMKHLMVSTRTIAVVRKVFNSELDGFPPYDLYPKDLLSFTKQEQQPKQETYLFKASFQCLGSFASKFKRMLSPISTKGAQYFTAQNCSDSRRTFIAW